MTVGRYRESITSYRVPEPSPSEVRKFPTKNVSNLGGLTSNVISENPSYPHSQPFYIFNKKYCVSWEFPVGG